MKVSLSEIWNTLEVIDSDKINQINLVLGNHQVTNVKTEVILKIKNGVDYDTELLPDLFTNSEITWQPNEYASHKDCLAGLNILKHQCEVQMISFSALKTDPGNFYTQLIQKLEDEAKLAVNKITNEETKLSRILGRFRKNIYPSVKFLLEHPANHPQIKFEAVLRQDFMAKTLFNEYHVKFSDLVEPYWELWIGKEPPKVVEVQSQETEKDGSKKKENETAEFEGKG